MGRKRCSAARAVGDHLEALVEQSLFPDLLESPPLGFDVIVVISHIGIVHVRPEAHFAGELFPHSLIGPDGFLALLDKRLDAIGFDLILSLDADLLLHFQLYRKAVGVPSGFSRDLLALHGMITRDHVLDDSGLNMADVGLSIRSGRTVVEHVGRAALTLFH